MPSSRRLQLLLIVAGLAVAGLTPTVAFSGSGQPAPVTSLVLVIGGHRTRMSEAALEKKVTSMTAAAAAKATIIVTVGGQTKSVPASAYRTFALNAAGNEAKANVYYVVPAILSYKADNFGGSPADPDLATSTKDHGYAGMTMALLGSEYDLTIPQKHLLLVRTSTASYCVQDTIDGRTAFKNGPSASVAFGRC
jgi:hypothetical protein